MKRDLIDVPDLQEDEADDGPGIVAGFMVVAIFAAIVGSAITAAVMMAIGGCQ